jgi:hypothetical protein
MSGIEHTTEKEINVRENRMGCQEWEINNRENRMDSQEWEIQGHG